MEDSRKDQNKNHDKSINAKLPKLVDAKFNGTHTDWLRFWNQFKAEIDSFDVSPTTKFSCLKELVDPKVRSMIDALPFNSEGYLRAKNILTNKYGKESEIINAHVNNIMSLPVIQGANPNKMLEFYEFASLGNHGQDKGSKWICQDDARQTGGDTRGLSAN